jgi:hypothetical protein
MNEQIPIPSSPSLPLVATGVSDIDNALEDLNSLDSIDVTEHAEIYSAIHQKLSTALTEIAN